MAVQPTGQRRRRLYRTLLITGGVFVAIVLGLHFWFIHNARSVLKEVVADRSGGKLKLELSQFSFNLLSSNIRVREASLVSTDTTQPTTYQVRFSQLELRVGSYFSLLFRNRLSLDSIKLHDPAIEVTRWRDDTSQLLTGENLSISQEMGKLYNSMLDGLEGFGIRRILITNARLSLINKMQPESEPVTVSNIYFNLVRTARDARKRDDFIEGEQDIELRTAHQNIALPGGRHRLSFRSFNLELFRKRIVLDSCTISARTTDSSATSYRIFFNKLSLVGVDFEAMYKQNLIRADSVYCEEPQFDINLDRGSARAEAGERKRPDLERLVRELTGDLDLAFVGVKDAGIRFHIIDGINRQSLFNANNDDFEMRGLRINADSARPVVVDRFDMLVRDYRLYNRDSSSAYTFDSIHFSNNKIALSDFTVSTEAKRMNELHNYRDFRIPYFELTGLDWYALIFEESLKAREALLLNPVIRYTRFKQPERKRRRNPLAVLRTLDDFITLDRVQVVNGQISMRLGPSAFDLQNVNLGLNSNRLLESSNIEGLRSGVERLSFTRGRFRLKDIDARLQNVRFTGRDLIEADRLVMSRGSSLQAAVSGIRLNDLLLDEEAGSVTVDGLHWRSAVVNLSSAPSSGGGKGGGNIQLRDISGNNTRFRYRDGKMQVTTFVDNISAASLSKEGRAPLRVEGLAISGRSLDLNSENLSVKADAYALTDGGPSRLSGVEVRRYEGSDSLRVEVPALRFTAGINSLLTGKLHLSSLAAASPFIRMVKRDTVRKKASGLRPVFRIDRLQVFQPDLQIATYRNDSAVLLRLPSSEGSSINLSGLAIGPEGVRIGNLAVNTTSATLVKRSGEVLGVEKGKVDLDVSDIAFGRRGDTPTWSGIVNALHLQTPNVLTLGPNRNRLTVQQASLGNLRLSSDYLTDFDRLVKYNVSAWLRTATGQYVDSNTTLNWYNAAYDYNSRTLSLDSFRYHPTRPRDSVIARTPYQTDYITFQSGPIKLTDFDLEKYERDSALIARTLSVTAPVITIYRDKAPPFLAGRIKPLPVDMIRNIKLPVSLDRVRLLDGTLSYTEKNAKTRAEGTLVLTHLSGGLQHIRNRGHREGDSLLFTLNAYLMDSALLNLRVKESYTDTLGGFLMTLRMRPTSLTFLNPVLAPLSNVILTSGTIDSFHLRAIGREDLAIGEMNMYYRNLKIRLVKGGEEGRSSFMQKVVTFLANTFVIRKNNDGRTGLVYFERLRDRSFFNYIVKTTFSGIATSVGVKSNRKYLKQYRRELRRRELPPIQFETTD